MLVAIRIVLSRGGETLANNETAASADGTTKAVGSFIIWPSVRMRHRYAASYYIVWDAKNENEDKPLGLLFPAEGQCSLIVVQRRESLIYVVVTEA